MYVRTPCKQLLESPYYTTSKTNVSCSFIPIMCVGQSTFGTMVAVTRCTPTKRICLHDCLLFLLPSDQHSNNCLKQKLEKKRKNLLSERGLMSFFTRTNLGPLEPQKNKLSLKNFISASM